MGPNVLDEALMLKQIGLRIDVDFGIGLARGVPYLLDAFKRLDMRDDVLRHDGTGWFPSTHAAPRIGVVPEADSAV